MATNSTPANGQDAEHRDTAAEIVRLVRELVAELHPARSRRLRIAEDSRLDRDLGLDSLAQAELLLRVERHFDVHLPDDLLGRAETVADLIAAVARGVGRPPRPGAGRRRPALEPLTETPETATTLVEVLDWHSQRHPERTHALLLQHRGEPRKLTYGELAEGARALGRGLQAWGLQPGEQAALMLPTGAEFFEAFLGVLLAGAIPVPIYPPARPSQIEAHMRRQGGILNNAGAAILIAPTDSRAVAALLRGLVETLRGVEPVSALRGMGEGGGELPAVRDPTQTALVQYTSGSTGDPKGVVLSHANLLANIRAMGAAMLASPQDVFVSWLPLYHDMGLIGAWLGSLYYGAVLAIMPPLTFLAHPAQWLWAIHDVRGTLSAAPNFAFELCLAKIDDEALQRLDLSSLRMVANGAEPVSARTVRRFVDRFAAYRFHPEAMAPVYGLAENAVGLAFPPPGRPPVIDRVERAALARDGVARPAAADQDDVVELVACGRPLPGHEVRIVDDAGLEVAERHEGRLQFRGPSATSGYFRNPAKTAELFAGDWLESGDKAYVAAGDVYVTGRVKDIIIRAGRNIYPQEVEEAVGDLPGIRKGCVAVFGEPDSESGTERLVVLAETRETAPRAREVLEARVAAAVAELLEEPPERVVLVPPRGVPKTSSGKIRRSAAKEVVRAGAGAGRRAVWWQVVRLTVSGLWPRLRRRTRAAASLLYAGWWWAVTGVTGAVLWPAVVLLPGRRLRWALVGGLARAAFAVMGIPLRVSGREHLPTGSAVLVSNHSSYLDGAALAAAIPGPLIFTAKRELARQLVAGIFLRRLGALFVERFDPRAGAEDTERAIEATREGERLIVFPEGTLLRMPGLLPFHLGGFVVAAQSGSPVVPVTIRGTRSVLRGGQWFPRRASIEVVIAPSVEPDGADFAAAVRLRDASRASILETSGEPDLAASEAGPSAA